METNEKRRKAFADTMSYMQSRNGVFAASNHLLTTFDWNPIGKIVDIGGGQGDTAIAIAESSMNTVCVVQDLPDVVALAEKKIPANMKSRIELTAHDFFEEQPVKDADVFFLRWILHDWSDENAIRIIRALIPALRPETQVVLQEFIVPESRTVPFYFEKTVR
jgi:predicted RNA methylase